MKRVVPSVQRVSVICLLACSFWLVGCSREAPTGAVTGTVTYDGAPVTKGVVVLTNPDSGIGASGALDASGRYQISSVRTGEYQVAIQPPPAPSPEEMAAGEKMETLDIPDKFQSAQTSGLTATINEGENTADFQLQ